MLFASFFGYLFGGLFVLGLIVVVLLFINYKATGTLWFNLRSSYGAGARAIDSRNAANNMKQAVEDAKAEISTYVGKLNKSQGQVESLTRESNEATSEVNRLTAQVQNRATEVHGDTNDAVLLDLAEQLTQAQVRAAEATHNLSEQTSLHNAVLGQVKDAVVTADNLEKDAERMGVNLDLSATRAELASVGINFQKSSAHSALAKASSYKKDIQQQIDTNNGAVEVAKQLSPKKGNAATAYWVAQQNAKATLAKLGIGAAATPSAPAAETASK